MSGSNTRNDEQSADGTSDITALRSILFDTLKGIKDGSVDIGKAKAINAVAQTIVDSARVEVEYLAATGGNSSSFIKPAADADKPLPNGITGITRHMIR